MSKFEDKMNELHCYSLLANTDVVDWSAEIERIESEVGYSLIKDYAEFFSTYGGYTPDGYAYFTYLEPYPKGARGILNVFFGLSPGSPYDLIKNARQYQGRIPEGLLPIADDPGGNIICLGLAEENRSRVYFWDHEREKMISEGEQPGYSNLYLVANSFDEFLNSLEFEEP